jgi:hypothetical protein
MTFKFSGGGALMDDERPGKGELVRWGEPRGERKVFVLKGRGTGDEVSLERHEQR